MDDLVVGALEESRVDRANRLCPLERKPRGQEHRVLLGDADVVVLLGQLLRELREPGPPRHRRGDADHPPVALGLLDERVGEDLRVLRRVRRRCRLLDLVEGGAVGRGHIVGGGGLRLSRRGRLSVDDRVRLRRVPLLHSLQAALLGRGEALALDRLDVDDDGALGGEGILERLAKGRHVVAVDHAHVGEVELLEHQAWGPVGLDRRLDLGPEALDPLAQAQGQPRQPGLDVLACVVEALVETDAVEVGVERADVGRDRHPVVVQHDHHRRLQAAGVVERLERHPARERSVADHRDDLAVLADPLAHRLLEADPVADRCRGVARAHDVVLGLGDRAERGEPAVLADRVEPIAAAGQDLVRVGLMADVPQDLVAGRVQERMEDGGQLAGAEVGAEVPADLADRVDDQLADLLRDLGELVVVEARQVIRPVDGGQQRL